MDARSNLSDRCHDNELIKQSWYQANVFCEAPSFCCGRSGTSLLWNRKFKRVSALFVILKHIMGSNLRFPRLLLCLGTILHHDYHHHWPTRLTYRSNDDLQWSAMIRPSCSVISPLWRKSTFLLQFLRGAGSSQSKQRWDQSLEQQHYLQLTESSSELQFQRQNMQQDIRGR